MRFTYNKYEIKDIQSKAFETYSIADGVTAYACIDDGKEMVALLVGDAMTVSNPVASASGHLQEHLDALMEFFVSEFEPLIQEAQDFLNEEAGNE